MPQKAPQPPRLLTPAQRQREAARLLVRLDDMLKAARKLSDRACDDVAVGGLNRYRRFAKKVRDFFALAAVTEEKLYASPELAASAMMTALDHLHARMLVLFVEASSSFFKLYIRVQELPIGANEICGLELRGLMAISEFLDDPRYEGDAGQMLRAEAEGIADMMRFVMDRSPPLPDFGDLPSVGPKGDLRRPVKNPQRGRRNAPLAANPPPVPSQPPPQQQQPQPEAKPFILHSWDEE